MSFAPGIRARAAADSRALCSRRSCSRRSGCCRCPTSSWPARSTRRSPRTRSCSAATARRRPAGTGDRPALCELRPNTGQRRRLRMAPARPADCALALKRPAGRDLRRRPPLVRGPADAVEGPARASGRAGPGDRCTSRSSAASRAQLVESVDDDGYLREDDAVLAERCGVAGATVRRSVPRIQRCEPTGVGARDLAECLALQLAERDRLDPAMAALLDNLPLLARADFPELMRRCGVDAEDLQDMIGEIKRLDPEARARASPPTSRRR